jgi:hypothetical protein
MKKLFVLLAAVALVTNAAFAQDSNEYYFDEQTSEGTNAEPRSSSRTPKKMERFNAELGPGFTFHWTNGIHDIGEDPDPVKTLEDKTVTANTSIGIGVTVNFSRVIGLTLDADFSYGAKLFGVATPSSGYLSLSAVNAFLGPVFYLFNNDVFRIPFGIGGHLYYFTDDLWVHELPDIAGQWVRTYDTQVGVGFSLGFQFHFDNGTYLFSRTNVAFDFIRFHSQDVSAVNTYDHTDIVKTLSWNVKPSAGVGIRF